MRPNYLDGTLAELKESERGAIKRIEDALYRIARVTRTAQPEAYNYRLIYDWRAEVSENIEEVKEQQTKISRIAVEIANRGGHQVAQPAQLPAAPAGISDEEKIARYNGLVNAGDNHAKWEAIQAEKEAKEPQRPDPMFRLND